MSVITVSRQYGSGGDEIARLVCHLTGYALFDKSLIAQAAIETGFSDQNIIDYSEDSYKMQGFIDRLMGRQKTIAQVSYWTETKDGVRTRSSIELNESHALILIRHAIEAAYKTGNYVIVGRGGQAVLANKADVIHVRIQAPLENRLIWVRNSPEMAERTFPDSVAARRAAQNLIEAADAASAGYIKRFYNLDWSDPWLYDLIINTARMTHEQAAHVIAAAIHQRQAA
jgi:cytidylate kinase